MLKIISKKEYQELKDIREKYEYLTGQMFTYCVGGRSRTARLMQLKKEELVHIIFDLVNEYNKLKEGKQ